MPDALGSASEFGGKVQRNRVQPAPHVPDESERMMLVYTTGDDSGKTDPDNGETFAGLLPEEKVIALREPTGVFKKGQVWDELRVAADQAIAELAATEG